MPAICSCALVRGLHTPPLNLGTIAAPLAAHVLCNIMGIPRLPANKAALAGLHSHGTILRCALGWMPTAAGLAVFVTALITLETHFPTQNR